MFIFTYTTAFSKDALNWSKIKVKTFRILQKIYFKLMLFFWTFYSFNNPEKYIPLKYLVAQLFSILIILIIIRNIARAPNQHIKKISKGSCDTEDGSNGCWKSSFAIRGINHILKKIKQNKKNE